MQPTHLSPPLKYANMDIVEVVVNAHRAVFVALPLNAFFWGGHLPSRKGGLVTAYAAARPARSFDAVAGRVARGFPGRELFQVSSPSRHPGPRQKREGSLIRVLGSGTPTQRKTCVGLDPDVDTVCSAMTAGLEPGIGKQMPPLYLRGDGTGFLLSGGKPKPAEVASGWFPDPLLGPWVDGGYFFQKFLRWASSGAPVARGARGRRGPTHRPPSRTSRVPAAGGGVYHSIPAPMLQKWNCHHPFCRKGSQHCNCTRACK